MGSGALHRFPARSETLMAVLYVLIPVSIALAVGFVLVCLAAIRKGQFDDLESPQWRILFDEAKIVKTEKTIP